VIHSTCGLTNQSTWQVDLKSWLEKLTCHLALLPLFKSLDKLWLLKSTCIILITQMTDVGPFVSNFWTTVVSCLRVLTTVGQLSVAIGRRRVRKTFRNGREVKCTAESAAASARTWCRTLIKLLILLSARNITRCRCACMKAFRAHAIAHKYWHLNNVFQGAEYHVGVVICRHVLHAHCTRQIEAWSSPQVLFICPRACMCDSIFPTLDTAKQYTWHHVYTWWFIDDQFTTYTHKIRTLIKLNLFVSICRTQHNATSTAQQFHLINAGAVGTFVSVDPVHPDAYSLNQHLQHGYQYIYTFICVYIYVYISGNHHGRLTSKQDWHHDPRDYVTDLALHCWVGFILFGCWFIFPVGERQSTWRACFSPRLSHRQVCMCVTVCRTFHALIVSWMNQSSLRKRPSYVFYSYAWHDYCKRVRWYVYTMGIWPKHASFFNIHETQAPRPSPTLSFSLSHTNSNAYTQQNAQAPRAPFATNCLPAQPIRRPKVCVCVIIMSHVFKCAWSSWRRFVKWLIQMCDMTFVTNCLPA